MLKPLAEKYGRDQDENTPGKLFTGILHRAHEKTGSQVVVLIDEYDAPLLDVLHDNETLDGMRGVMQEFYQPLKANEAIIKFCFITGITKFSQLSIFSTLNNIKNVSLLPKFASICGFTDREVLEYFKDGISRMAERYKVSTEDMFARVKWMYDGYNFAGNSESVYNPFSLLNAVDDQMLKGYWSETGTPTFLIRQMKHFHTDITSLDKIEVPETSR